MMRLPHSRIQLTESRINTFSSVFDNQSVYEPIIQPIQTFSLTQEFKNIRQWALISLSHLPAIETTLGVDIKSRYFIMTVHSVDGILPKRNKIQSKSRHYVKLVVNLFNEEEKSYSKRSYTSEALALKASSSNKQLQSSDKVQIFMYLPEDQSNIQIHIECLVVESTFTPTREEIMVDSYSIGNLAIDFLTDRKQLQQRQLQSHYTYQATISSQIHGPSLSYQIFESDQLALLENVIPSLCAFGSNDRILGIQGKQLPNQSFNIKLCQAYSMKMQLHTLEIPIILLKEAMTKQQSKIRHNYYQVGKIESICKEVRLNQYCHNGWTVVSSSSTQLKQLEKPSQKYVSASKVKKDIKSSTKINEVQIFHSDGFIYLPLLFQEEDSVVILEVAVKVESKFVQDLEGKSLRQSNKVNVETVTIPICFAIKSSTSIENDQVISLSMINGDFRIGKSLNLYLESLRMEAIILEERQSYIKTQKQLSKQSIQLLSCKENSEQKTIISKINFEVYLQKIDDDQDQTKTNKSNYKVQVHNKNTELDDLRIEKEKVVRMRRKLKEEKRQKLIEMNQQIPFLDPSDLKEELFKQQIYTIQGEKEEQAALLDHLKQKLHQIQEERTRNLREKYQAQFNQYAENGQFQNFSKEKEQLLPQRFIDFKPMPTLKGNSAPKSINFNDKWKISHLFEENLIREERKPSSELIQQIIKQNLHLNIALASLEDFGLLKGKQIFLEVEEFQKGNMISKKIAVGEKVIEGECMNLPLESRSKHSTLKTIQYLMNGLLNLYLRISGLGVPAMVSFLMEELFEGDHLKRKLMQSAIVYQEMMPIAKISLVFTLMPGSGEKTHAPIQRHLGLERQLQGFEDSQLNRIQRYKKEMAKQQNHAGSLLANIVKQVTSQDTQIAYRRMTKQYLKLIVFNASTHSKLFQLFVHDHDLQYYSDGHYQELEILSSNDPRIQELSTQNQEFLDLKPVYPNADRLIHLQAGQKAWVPAVYCSLRKCIPKQLLHTKVDSFLNSENKSAADLLYEFNHHHTIGVSQVNFETKAVELICNVEIIPIPQISNLYFEQYVDLKKEVNFHFSRLSPQSCAFLNDQLMAASSDCMEVHLGPLDNNHLRVSNLVVFKNVGFAYEPNPFANMTFVCWGAESIEVSGRLWETLQIMIRVSIDSVLQHEEIIKELVPEVRVVSKHCNVAIRQAQIGAQAKYQVNRNSNSILIKLDVTFESVGNSVAKIDVYDHRGNVFHRISLRMYASIGTIKETIKINLPTIQEVQILEPFSYLNATIQKQQYELKSVRPDLIRPQINTLQIQPNQSHTISFIMEIQTIKAHPKQALDGIVVGLKARQLIEYFMFKFIF